MSVTMRSVAKRSRRPYIIDYETRNISFLQTHQDLKRLGIKQNDFFLILYNERLQGVDPYSPFLTREQMVDIIIECTNNPWYFLREVCQIPDQGKHNCPCS